MLHLLSSPASDQWGYCARAGSRTSGTSKQHHKTGELLQFCVVSHHTPQLQLYTKQAKNTLSGPADINTSDIPRCSPSLLLPHFPRSDLFCSPQHALQLVASTPPHSWIMGRALPSARLAEYLRAAGGGSGLFLSSAAFLCWHSHVRTQATKTRSQPPPSHKTW